MTLTLAVAILALILAISAHIRIDGIAPKSQSPKAPTDVE